MKKLLGIAVLTGVLSACGTTNYKSDYSAIAQQNAALQSKQMEDAISKAPEWMTRLPKSANAVYENGTATSNDFAMADMKAKTIAYAKICTAAGGKVRSQTKVYQQDNGTTSVEASEMVIRSICPDIDITGVETVDMKHVADGNRIRTYVLVALPFGDANSMKKMKQADQNTANARADSKEAFKELDEITGNTKPETKKATEKGTEISVVKPDGTSTGLNLMPVENEEYKARREAALKKPGAVIAQTSVE
jgi:hypothetical protein